MMSYSGEREHSGNGDSPRNPATGTVPRGYSWVKFVARCILVVASIIVGLVAVNAYYVVLRYGAPAILSGRFFAKYDWNAITAGGAFDQSGLTKLMFCILVLELFAVLGRNLFITLSCQRTWRVGVNVIFLVVFVLPFMMSVLCAWELSRYIAVMGVTHNRILGVRYLILFLFTPLFCAVRWCVGSFKIKKMIFIGVGCLIAAYCVFSTIDAMARQSVASHPRPCVCWPNRVGVPSQSETPVDYGLMEVIFGVPTLLTRR